jgi:hypothetical protein
MLQWLLPLHYHMLLLLLLLFRAKSGRTAAA